MLLNQALFSQPYIKQKFVGEITGAKSRTAHTKYWFQLTELGFFTFTSRGVEKCSMLILI